MTEDSNSEVHTSSTFSCHMQVRIIANSDRFYERGSEIKALFHTYVHNFRLTTLGLSCVIDNDCSTRIVTKISGMPRFKMVLEKKFSFGTFSQLSSSLMRIVYIWVTSPALNCMSCPLTGT